MRIALLITLCLCGCAVQPARPVITKRTVQNSIAQAQAVAPGEMVKLAWDTTTPSECRLYQSVDKANWSLLATTSANEATVSIVPPKWFEVRNVDGRSNRLLVSGKTNAITVTGEHAANPAGPWQAYSIPVYNGPADQSMQVFRVKAVKTGGWQTVSEP